METIPKSNCIKIGYVQKPHGINGELAIRFQEEYYESLEEVNTLFLDIEGLLVPFFIDNKALKFRTGDSAIVRLEWIDTEKEAKKHTGLQLYLKREDIILVEKSASINMLQGFLIIDQLKNQIGTITEVNDYSGNIILTTNYLNNEIMIPFNEDFLIELDETNKVIQLDLPDGILEMNEE